MSVEIRQTFHVEESLHAWVAAAQAASADREELADQLLAWALSFMTSAYGPAKAAGMLGCMAETIAAQGNGGAANSATVVAHHALCRAVASMRAQGRSDTDVIEAMFTFAVLWAAKVGGVECTRGQLLRLVDKLEDLPSPAKVH